MKKRFQSKVQDRRVPAATLTTSSRTRSIRGKRRGGSSAVSAPFHSILVPIDFSSESTRALKFAAGLARREGGALSLVHVVGPIYDLRDYGYGPVRHRRPNASLLRNAKQRLRALGGRHLGSGVQWRFTVRSGTAPNQILKEAEDIEAGIIIMPTRGLSHAPPLEVGSTAERVVRHALCPVLVLPGRRVDSSEIRRLR
jgi:nucleotide-binding universal stress UspA family protein